jgi:hypothetical protein
LNFLESSANQLEETWWRDAVGKLQIRFQNWKTVQLRKIDGKP